ncbi:hypothetical protein [Acetobacter cibinongensis]|uniref:Uncharacterized protein n=1 Tax=Acetobacter cibinongensis TaxID=146475 RepID=A0A1Z5YT18_9PROT|nr:hypothetical protein [Acetobacter cibinongensis]OUJ01410.1 hypothetical protein HK14_09570 [Acetobacter cibinongensis]GAN59607.1 hypothetical protein Abci_007_010 [Acetobacter cibinongensis]GBQ15438.1 hypothetical protein AA0482_1239 [Acetobacter cibinongensis NRIC 0482]GEL59130.1 hypothetical protein ACI01nite_17320 [Acetobacter cibinongensis]
MSKDWDYLEKGTPLPPGEQAPSTDGNPDNVADTIFEEAGIPAPNSGSKRFFWPVVVPVLLAGVFLVAAFWLFFAFLNVL